MKAITVIKELNIALKHETRTTFITVNIIFTNKRYSGQKTDYLGLLCKNFIAVSR